MYPYIHSFHNKTSFIKMGEDISKLITPPPLTFHDCFKDGRVDITKFMIFNEAINEEEEGKMFETQYFQTIIKGNVVVRKVMLFPQPKRHGQQKGIFAIVGLTMEPCVRLHLKILPSTACTLKTLLLERDY